MIILLYTSEKKGYLGFIPTDQVGFVEKLRKVIQQQKNNHQAATSNQTAMRHGQQVKTINSKVTSTQIAYKKQNQKMSI